MRNTAFKLAEKQIEQQPRQTLRWLNRVDRVIDLATRGRADATHEVAFAPGNGCRDMVIRHLRAARRTLDICVFTITDDRLREQILNAKVIGVQVRIITDDDKSRDHGSDISWLRSRDIPVRFDDHPKHMHHKFAVVDQQVLLAGSFNWTRGGSKNHENMIATSDAALVDAFGDEFNKLWAKFSR